jgi:hypothetical protein
VTLSPLQQLALSRGIALPDLSAPSAASDVKEVPFGPEMRRILNLERRPPPANSKEAEELAKFLTAKLARNGSPYPGPLRALQAAALHDVWKMSKGAYLPVPAGFGKAQPNNEPVLTAQGWRPIGGVVPGDFVYGSDGQTHEVLGVFPQGKRPIYKLTFSDGTTALSDIDHQWTFDMATDHPRPRRTKTLREWMGERLTRPSGKYRANRIFLPMAKPIQYPAAVLPIDPYTLGVLLGDGSLSSGSVGLTSEDQQIVDGLVLPDGVTARRKMTSNSGKAFDYYLSHGRLFRSGSRGLNLGKGQGVGGGGLPNKLLDQLRGLGLMGTTSYSKFVPAVYMRGSVAQRLALLQGLFDTDGSPHHDVVDFLTASDQLADAVAELAESLGGTAIRADKRMVYRGEAKRYYRLHVRLPRDLVPFRLERKVAANREATAQRKPFRALTAIDYVGEQEATCISVASPDQLYITRHHILTHNTLIAYLAFTIAQAKRPLYMSASGLIKAAEVEFKKFAPHWHGVHPSNIMTLGYEKLSRESAGVQMDEHRNVTREALLDRLNPDFVFCDEAHRTQNKSASCTRKFQDWRKKNPHVKVVFATGTPGVELTQIAHQLGWCLGAENCPLPLEFHELQAWSAAVSRKTGFMGAAVEVGALAKLCTEEERAQLQTADEAEQKNIARFAIGRRIRETRGVVGIEGGELDIPISVSAVFPEREDPAVNEMFVGVRARQMLPDGELIVDGTAMARHAYSLGCGFWLRWKEPVPPQWWLDARKEWNGFARDDIQHNQSGRYSEEAVKVAIRKGVKKDGGILARWEAAIAKYRAENGGKDPETEEVVFSEEAVEFAANWAESHPHGIVWVFNRGFGARVAKAIGTSYYEEEGLDHNGRFIEHHPSGPVVASISANGTGRNLQHKWRSSLWIGCAPNEQSLARVHRPGQKHPVTNDVFFGAREHANRYWQAVAHSYERQLTLHQAQRLQYAVSSVPQIDEVEKRGGARWTR